MDYPKKTFLHPTQVRWLNFLLFQWLFFRLQGNTTDGHTDWEIVVPVVPLTGWWSRYVPRRRWTISLTNKL